MANALTLRAKTADAVSCVVWTTFAMPLCVRKKFALTVSVYEKRAASGWLTP